MYKVLLVDDETINYQLFEKLVDWQGKGFEIAGYAADGQEAVQKYEEIAPDLIFMDIQLPFMDGLECVRCIRESDKKVKIVIVSAYGDFSYAQRAIRYDVQDFLLKPVSRLMLNQLVDRMKEELDQRAVRTKEDLFRNEWTEAVQEVLNGREGAGAVPHDEQKPMRSGMSLSDGQRPKMAAAALLDGQKPKLAGITLLDEQGRRLQGSAVKKMMEGLLARSGIRNGLLGCSILNDGEAILLWDRLYDTAAAMDAAAGIFDLWPSARLYVCDRDETDRADWLEQFSRKEDYGFYDEGGRVYRLENCPFNDREIRIERAEQRIAKAIASNSAEELMEITDAVFDTAKRGCIHPQILKEAVLNLLVQVKFLLRKFEQQESFLLMRNVRLENIHSLHTMEGLKRFLQEKISATFRDIDESFYQPGRRIVFRVNAFTELHYGEASFSVQTAADYIGISKNYFTSLYKEQAGIGFWEYVTKLRMEEAARLLMTTDQMTRDVGRTVGYESEYHFSRKFKEYTGESPNIYRKSRRSK